MCFSSEFGTVGNWSGVEIVLLTQRTEQEVNRSCLQWKD